MLDGVCSDDTPAKNTIIHYFDESKNSYAGRPRTTLPTILNKDLELAAQTQQHMQEIPNQLKGLKDLRALETLANDLRKWKSIVANMQVLALPKPEPPKLRSLRTRKNEKQ